MRTETELAVIVPVYNEGACIATVLEEWVRTLTDLRIMFVIHVYNDGSTDNTAAVLQTCAEKWPSVSVHNKENTGHGPTILYGYWKAASYEWVFQTDSDNEMNASYFGSLWAEKDRYDFLIGRRAFRVQPWSRRLVSAVSRMVIWALFGRGLYDVNTPYRLMRTEKFAACFAAIPAHTFAPNILVSGFAMRRKMRIFEQDIPHRHRQTGRVSIKKFKLLVSACRSFWQTVCCACRWKMTHGG